MRFRFFSFLILIFRLWLVIALYSGKNDLDWKFQIRTQS